MPAKQSDVYNKTKKNTSMEEEVRNTGTCQNSNGFLSFVVDHSLCAIEHIQIKSVMHKHKLSIRFNLHV